MIKLGNKNIKDVYLGGKKISKIYLGDKLVYEADSIFILTVNVDYEYGYYTDTRIYQATVKDGEIYVLYEGENNWYPIGYPFEDYYSEIIAAPYDEMTFIVGKQEGVVYAEYYITKTKSAVGGGGKSLSFNKKGGAPCLTSEASPLRICTWAA